MRAAAAGRQGQVLGVRMGLRLIGRVMWQRLDMLVHRTVKCCG